MPKTIIFDSESTHKNNASKISLPKEVPFLGQGLNHLYTSWYQHLGFLVNPVGHDETDTSNIDDLVNFALSELSLAELSNKNFLIQLDTLEREIEGHKGPNSAYRLMHNEGHRWNMRHCKVEILVRHLDDNNRLEEIIESNKILGKSRLYKEIKLLPDTLIRVIALTELSQANEMVRNGDLNNIGDSLYEFVEAQRISASNTAFKWSERNAREEKSDNGKKGASIRADKFEAVKAYVIELANPFAGQSANKLAHQIKDLVMIRARSLNAPLSQENAQKTIQKYILEHRKQSF
jgi:hypothetical protein